MALSKKELHRYLAKVAYYLGSWKVDTRDEYSTYLKGEGMTIYIRQASHRQAERGRLFFSGVLPREYIGRRETATISVSYARPPQSVANDIKKRLLIDFREELAKAKKWVELDKKDTDNLNYFTRLVVNAGFDSIRYGYQDKGYKNTIHARQGNINMEYDLSEKYDSSIKINSLNKDQMIRLAYFLKGL